METAELPAPRPSTVVERHGSAAVTARRALLEQLSGGPARKISRIGGDQSMPSPMSVEEAYAFDAFRLVPARRLLFEGEKALSLGGRAYELLAALVANAGSVLSKEDLLARAWPDVFVQDGSLRVQIASLRKILRDGVDGRRYIVNDAGRGYCFVAPVRSERSVDRTAGVRDPCPTDNLPTAITRVVGRQVPVERLTAELLQHRFVTIAGPGGIGKTTVALMVAAAMRRSCPDGAWFVDLASIGSPVFVASVVASTLGLAVKSNDPVPDLIAFLRSKQLLIVLDNCEHVIEAAAVLAETILSRASKIRILATSRLPLKAKGERVHLLGPLDVPPKDADLTADSAMRFSAVQLFVDRAEAAIEFFELRDRDVLAVGEICRRLDGMALAIELATARVGTLGVAGVAAELNNRFELLSEGLRTAPPRHRTLLAVFDWSYQLLPAREQHVFRCLSVLAGGFTLEAAQAVAWTAAISRAQIAGILASLVVTSLVTVNAPSGTATYRLLESARAYGHERLLASGEHEAVSLLHAEFCLNRLEDANSRSAGWSSAEWAIAYRKQLDDVRLALDWSSRKEEWLLRDALTIAAVPLLTHLSLDEECRARVQAALIERPVQLTLDEATAMQLYAALGMSLLYTRGSGPDATAAWGDCLAAAEPAGNIDYQLRAIRGLWTASFNAGDIHEVERLTERFERVAGPTPLLEDELLHERMRGMEMFYHGKLGKARKHLQRIYDEYSKETRGSDVLRFQFDQTVMACVNLSKVLWLQGFADQAKSMARRSLDIARNVNHELSLTYALAMIACRVSILTGDFAAADDQINELLQRADLDRSAPWKYFAQCWRGASLSRQGDAEAAVGLLSESLLSIPEGSFGAQHTRFLGELAYARARAGQLGGAMDDIQRALAICERLDETWYMSELLRLQGEIMVIGGSPASIVSHRFNKARELAGRQGALSLELRAATSLVRFGALGSNHSDLIALREVYGRFVEGFDTADLVDAKKLLDDADV